MFSLRLYQRKLIKCEHDESLNSGTDGDTKTFGFVSLLGTWKLTAWVMMFYYKYPYKAWSTTTVTVRFFLTPPIGMLDESLKF